MRCFAKLIMVVLIAAMVQVALEGLPGLFTMASSTEKARKAENDVLSAHPPGPFLGWLDRTMGGAAWDVKPTPRPQQSAASSK